MYKIILVDDEDSVLEGLQKIIHWESYGFEIVATANDGIECLEIIDDIQPDLIITDIKMRQMDGLNMVDAIRNTERYQPKVIFLSGYNEFEFVQQALAFHACNYILKPILEEELMKVLTQVKEELDKDKVIEEALHRVKKHDMQTYLFNLIYDNRQEEQEKLIKELKLNDKEKYQAAIIRMNMQEQINGSRSKYYKNLQKLIGEIIEEEECITCSMYEIDRQQIGLFLAFELEEQGIEFSQKFSYQLHHEITNNSEVNINITFGDMVQTIDDFSQSYNHALYAQSFHIYYENKMLIRYDEIKSYELLPLNKKELTDEKELLDAILENDYEKIYSFFSYNFMKIKSKKIIFQEIIDYINKLYLYVMEELGKENIEEVYPSRMQLLGIKESRPSLNKIQKELLNFSIWASDLLKSQTKNSKVMKDILVYVNNNYKEEISLKSIAEHFYLNPVYLGQIFQKNVEVGFKKYLENLRLEESKRLLNTTQKTVYEIAYEIGYNNPEYYSRVFQKAYGKTPSQYRNRKK